jgi:Phage terminase large subunit
MLATDLALALDPVLFAAEAGYPALDAWQVQLLRSQAQQVILNVTRQGGKSSSTALLALHTALYQPGALVLLLAPALRQSQELFRKVQEAYGQLQHLPATASEESALRVAFATGSRIVCLPGKEQTIRGFSAVSVLVVDECARVADELIHAVRPMLVVSGGRIILMSTPFGTRGTFYEVWTQGGPSWERIKVTAHDVPRIPAAWLAQERQALPAWSFRQEYLCEFTSTDMQVFASEFLESAVDNSIERWI